MLYLCNNRWQRQRNLRYPSLNHHVCVCGSGGNDTFMGVKGVFFVYPVDREADRITSAAAAKCQKQRYMKRAWSMNQHMCRRALGF